MQRSFNHQPLKIGVINELFEQCLSDASIAPTTESAVRVLPVAVTRGQIAPGRPRAQNPKHCIDELSIVFGGDATLMVESFYIALCVGMR